MKYPVMAIVVMATLAACNFYAASVDVSPDSNREVVFVERSVLLPTVVELPSGFEREKEYPLIIGLHGHGGTGEKLLRFAPLFAEAGMIFAVPKAPYAFQIRGEIGGDWLNHAKDSTLVHRDIELTATYIVKVLEDLKAHYRVDHAYLLGFSEGGGFVYRIGIRHHELFSAFITVGAPFDPKWFPGDQIASASHLPVLIVHGQKDTAARAYARRAMEAFSTHGYGITYITYPGGHQLTADGVKLAVKWIKRR